LIDEAHAADQPFFLGVTPIAPHSQSVFTAGSPIPAFGAPVPAKRHQDLFPDVKIPRSANFNPDSPSGASWVKTLPKLNDTVVDYLDDYYRKRLQSLQAVDEMIPQIIDRLTQYNLLDNTYLIYTTDNGYHLGTHRIQNGKTCAYEEDINIPFYVRGPNVPIGASVDAVTTHTDIIPTIFTLAGIPLRDDFDGMPMPIFAPGQQTAQNAPEHDHVMVEFWGMGGMEAPYGSGGSLSLLKRSTIVDCHRLIALSYPAKQHI
jgi:N-acetylglucosamine-6-sulfatase